MGLVELWFAGLLCVVDWLSPIRFASSCGGMVVDIVVWLVLVFLCVACPTVRTAPFMYFFYRPEDYCLRSKHVAR